MSGVEGGLLDGVDEAEGAVGDDPTARTMETVLVGVLWGACGGVDAEFFFFADSTCATGASLFLEEPGFAGAFGAFANLELLSVTIFVSAAGAAQN